MKKIGLFLISIFYIFFICLYSKDIKQNIIDTCLLFVCQIMPSILPMYFFSNILLSTGIISKISNLLTKLLHFENQYSSSIYLISILIGNPTTSILINQEITNNHISKTEGIRLMKFTNFLNPLFLISVCGNISWIFIVSTISTSIIIGYLSKNIKYNKTTFIYNLSIKTIINNTPTILLNILVIMIIVNIIKSPLRLLPNNIVITYIGDLLDISSGLNNVIKHNNILLTSILIYSNGFSIFIQTKQSSPFIDTFTFTKYKIINIIISTTITLLIHFIFYC